MQTSPFFDSVLSYFFAWPFQMRLKAAPDMITALFISVSWHAVYLKIKCNTSIIANKLPTICIVLFWGNVKLKIQPRNTLTTRGYWWNNMYLKTEPQYMKTTCHLAHNHYWYCLRELKQSMSIRRQLQTYRSKPEQCRISKVRNVFPLSFIFAIQAILRHERFFI